MKYMFREKIIDILLASKKEGITEGKLLQLLGTAKKDKKRVLGVVEALIRDGVIYRSKGNIKIRGAKYFFEGTVVKVARSHGFIRNEKTEEDAFVRGRELMGAVPGDRVLARITEFKDENHNSDTAEVVIIRHETEDTLIGTVVDVNGKLKLRPDSFVADPLTIVKWNGNKIKDGDKVKFSINTRAETPQRYYR